MTTEHIARELRTLQSAVGHLSYLVAEDPAQAATLRLTDLAWRHLPGEEAASIERACSFANGKCEHTWLSLCKEPECVALVERTYREWNAEHEAARAEERQMSEDEALDREMERFEP